MSTGNIPAPFFWKAGTPLAGIQGPYLWRIPQIQEAANRTSNPSAAQANVVPGPEAAPGAVVQLSDDNIGEFQNTQDVIQISAGRVLQIRAEFANFADNASPGPDTGVVLRFFENVGSVYTDFRFFLGPRNSPGLVSDQLIRINSPVNTVLTRDVVEQDGRVFFLGELQVNADMELGRQIFPAAAGGRVAIADIFFYRLETTVLNK